jgi:hypothetical protein
VAESIRVEMSATLNSLDRNIDEIEAAAFYAIGQVALRVEKLAKENASGPARKRNSDGTLTPPRHINWAGGGPNGPNVITGTLRRSIHTEVRKGFATFEATVSPSVYYAKSVETGEGRRGVGYPFIMPAANAIAPKAQAIFTAAFNQRRR